MIKQIKEGEKGFRTVSPPASSSLQLYTPSIWHEQSTLLHSIDSQIPLYIDGYFSHIYPLCPAVDRDVLYHRIAHREHLMDQQFAALVLASASMSLMVPGANFPTAEDQADLMMREAIRMHNTTSLGQGAHTTLNSLATSMLIGAYQRAKGWNDASHLRTKETLGLAELLNLHQQKGYDGLTAVDREIATTLYWLIRVAERLVKEG